MQNERFKIHFYKEGNVINKDGKHRISMKVRFEGKEIYRKAIGYLPEGNWESGTVVGRSLEAQEMRSILDQVHKEYFEAADFVVNHLGRN